jgi:hypothetical protein
MMCRLFETYGIDDMDDKVSGFLRRLEEDGFTVDYVIQSQSYNPSYDEDHLIISIFYS